MMNLRNYLCYAGHNRNKGYFSVKLTLLRHTRLLSTLALMVQIQRGRGFEGGSRPVAARVQARKPFPPGCLQPPGDGCRHVGGGGDVRVFTLAVLPAQSAQVPFLAKNVALDRGEGRLCQNCVRVFFVPKGQGGEMHFISHLHPPGTPGSSSSRANFTSTRAAAPSSVSIAAATAAAAATASTSNASVSAAAASPAAAAAAASFTD